MQIRDIIAGLERLAPKNYAESWDNVGLLVGDGEWPVKKVMVALDATEEVIDQCVTANVDLLITHHPMIFSKINRVTTGDLTGRKIVKLLSNKIGYYAMHTNFDVSVMGREAAAKFNLANPRVLMPTVQEHFYKVVVYVPVDSVEKVRGAFLKEDAGHIGNYSGCMFGTEGVGSFQPEEGTNPYIGEVNEMTFTKEVRLETIVRPERLKATIDAMLRAHPYEEVAYDVYRLENEGNVEGIGYYGYLERDMALVELVKATKEALGIEHVSVCGSLGKKVASVAISPGSGKSVIKHALAANCDVLITGDIDHHAALDAKEAGLMIIDAGHFGTEHLFVPYVREYVEALTKKQLEVVEAKEEGPFQVL